jgi:hypothetical protein
MPSTRRRAALFLTNRSNPLPYTWSLSSPGFRQRRILDFNRYAVVDRERFT